MKADMHISYAMQNTEATQSLIWLNSASELKDWSFLAIQAIIIAGVILAIIHATREHRKTGSPSALITLFGCFFYGLCIDILSYYTVENFWHGEFSVMFLYNKLPLYIALFYPAFMYHAYMIIRRYDFAPVTEAICVGFYAGLMYLIFDNLGPMLQWWIWDTSDPTTLPYVDAVPLTSYHWFFTFTIAFSLINRVISYNWVASQKPKPLLFGAIAIQPVLTILLGSMFFIPYNLFAKNMPPYDMLPWAQNLEMAALVHALTFAAAGWLFLTNWRRPKGDRDALLMAFPFIFLVGHAYIYIAKFHLYFDVTPAGTSNGFEVGNLPAVILALIGTCTIVLLSHPTSRSER
ncbi:Uncharacterised protein [BD1-7 clade bacterium]|uniref:DUF7802 domain-containing protein n=1 Tax=BD1-7 clade bacterium TaxID=2029982 RepID=A0A5S9QPR2_9GAMM|nr:Uncharacterised protein [BD1-7 clade bacterium]CAA0120482.1 Uncharacterised protein [BD1-7 clade bacterium]